MRLHLDFSETSQELRSPPATDMTTLKKSKGMSVGSGILAGAVVLTSIGVLVYLKRTKL